MRYIIVFAIWIVFGMIAGAANVAINGVHVPDSAEIRD